jgi:hypothetical protein
MSRYPDDGVSWVNLWFKWKIIFLYLRVVSYILSTVGFVAVAITVMNYPQYSDQIFTGVFEFCAWFVGLAALYIVGWLIYLPFRQRPGPMNLVPRDDRRGRDYEDGNGNPGF